MLPLEKRGLQFCTADASRSQLHNDPSNATFNVLEQLLGEMAALFDDEVCDFHVCLRSFPFFFSSFIFLSPSCSFFSPSSDSPSSFSFLFYSSFSFCFSCVVVGCC